MDIMNGYLKSLLNYEKLDDKKLFNSFCESYGINQDYFYMVLGQSYSVLDNLGGLIALENEMREKISFSDGLNIIDDELVNDLFYYLNKNVNLNDCDITKKIEYFHCLLYGWSLMRNFFVMDFSSSFTKDQLGACLSAQQLNWHYTKKLLSLKIKIDSRIKDFLDLY